MKSVSRFIKNNFEDDYKQQCIDLFLGKSDKCQTYGIRTTIENSLKKYENQYTENGKIQIFIGTWNLAGESPREGREFDIESWLLPSGRSFPA